MSDLLKNSNCYGFAIGINSPITPGSNNNKTSPLDSWGYTANTANINNCISLLIENILDDGIVDLPVSKNTLKAMVYLFDDDVISFHVVREIGNYYVHKLYHRSATNIAYKKDGLFQQLFSKHSDLKKIYFIDRSFFVEKNFLWTCDDFESFSIYLNFYDDPFDKLKYEFNTYRYKKKFPIFYKKKYNSSNQTIEVTRL